MQYDCFTRGANLVEMRVNHMHRYVAHTYIRRVDCLITLMSNDRMAWVMPALRYYVYGITVLPIILPGEMRERHLVIADALHGARASAYAQYLALCERVDVRDVMRRAPDIEHDPYSYFALVLPRACPRIENEYAWD